MDTPSQNEPSIIEIPSASSQVQFQSKPPNAPAYDSDIEFSKDDGEESENDFFYKIVGEPLNKESDSQVEFQSHPPDEYASHSFNSENESDDSEECKDEITSTIRNIYLNSVAFISFAKVQFCYLKNYNVNNYLNEDETIFIDPAIEDSFHEWTKSDHDNYIHTGKIWVQMNKEKKRFRQCGAKHSKLNVTFVCPEEEDAGEDKSFWMTLITRFALNNFEEEDQGVSCMRYFMETYESMNDYNQNSNEEEYENLLQEWLKQIFLGEDTNWDHAITLWEKNNQCNPIIEKGHTNDVNAVPQELTDFLADRKSFILFYFF